MNRSTSPRSGVRRLLSVALLAAALAGSSGAISLQPDAGIQLAGPVPACGLCWD